MIIAPFPPTPVPVPVRARMASGASTVLAMQGLFVGHNMDDAVCRHAMNTQLIAAAAAHRAKQGLAPGSPMLDMADLPEGPIQNAQCFAGRTHRTRRKARCLVSMGHQQCTMDGKSPAGRPSVRR